MGRMPVASIPQEQTDTLLLRGGMDLVTPKISLPPGRVVSGENWEVSWNQGYTRIAGYERFSGKSPKPADAEPVYVGVAYFLRTPTIGSTLTGQVSGRTGIVAGYGPNYINLFNLSAGSWSHQEFLMDGVDAVAYSADTSPSLSSVDAAKQKAASADQARAMISGVPGSGPIRGVFHLVVNGQDQYFAVRDDSTATSKWIYKATTNGWVLTVPYQYVTFTAGQGTVPVDGDTLTQGSVSATIKRVVHASGAWSGSNDAAGRLILDTVSGGNFTGGAATAGSATVTLGGIDLQVTMVAGGTFQFWKSNFSGLDLDKRIYGADGVGTAIEFDGDVLVPIITGTTPDTPSCVVEHLNYLMLAIRSSVIYSAPGKPYQWTAADGAGEFAVGDTITNMSSHPASQTASALGVYCQESTHFLFGKSPSDWAREPYKNGVGAFRRTLQTLDHAYVFHTSGVIDYRAAESFGNFVQSGLTYDIQTLISQIRASVACSTVDRNKSQYRVFFTDGTGLYVTIVNGRLRGTLPVRFADVPVVMHESLKANGDPVMLFGDANGMVYEMERGTSFDGDPINAPMVLSWFFGKNPMMEKTWRRLKVELEAKGLVEFRLGYSLQYGDTASVPKPLDQQIQNLGAGVPKWDNFTWDYFVWDGVPPFPEITDVRGKSVNIQFSLTSNANYLEPFTLSAIVLVYINRRLQR